MYRSLIAALSLAAAVALAAPANLAQEPAAEDGTRGAFFKHRPERASSGSARKSPGRKTGRRNTPAPPAPADAPAPSGDRAIGLGYTIFERSAKGVAVRTDPKQVFHTGDAVRFMLETNVDGYLYIFNTENDGPASMIFPDPRLNGGSNRVAAHTPVEIPSRKEADPEARWFVFKAPASVEKVYFVVTRAPLPGVPPPADLASYQASYGTYWQPSAPVWEAVTRGKGIKVDESLLARYGQAETAEETDALTRSIGLPKTAAQPTVVRVNALADSEIHVTVVDLAHE